MSSDEWRAIALELHVPCFEQALAFYQRFGFVAAWREPRYLVLKNGLDLIAFYGGDADVASHSYFSRYPSTTKRGYGVEIILLVDDLEAALAALSPTTPILAPITLRPWGVRDFRIEDPFGYYLRVTERYDISRCETNSPATR